MKYLSSMVWMENKIMEDIANETCADEIGRLKNDLDTVREYIYVENERNGRDPDFRGVKT